MENTQKFLDLQDIKTATSALVKKHGRKHALRIKIGVNQVSTLWREEDGDANEFHEFCLEQFVSDPDDLNLLFNRFQDNLEKFNGHSHELCVAWDKPMQDERLKKTPADFCFATYDPSAHFTDDCFKTKIAFVCLLNFKIDTLEECTKNGGSWSRRRWAESRLADIFPERIPAFVEQKISEIIVVADDYINEYNLSIGNMEVNGKPMFPENLKLISHWGLRDHIRALYSEPDSLEAQKVLYHTMNRIVCQTIPQRVINNPDEKWDPYEDMDTPEPNTRYAHLLKVFRAVSGEDCYRRQNKTHLERCFNEDREVSEEVVEGWIKQLLSSPVAKQVGEYITARLGRKLEPFDIWYDQFTPKQDAEKLNALVKEKYPSLAHLQIGIVPILVKLGFDFKTAREIANKIEVDPARSAGHASPAESRDGKHRLRVRMIEEDGKFRPNYQSFNIFMHELGHCVEMFFSTQKIDYNLLRHVPNTAFTEALAFIFEAKDLEILGASEENKESKYLNILEEFWGAFEIAGVSLVDMKIWRWMYANQNATPEELKIATVIIACDVWNEYFAPIFGVKDQPILAIYSHIIDCILYIPNYFMGSLIQRQIQEYLKDKNLAEEVERMYTIGDIAPDIWMKQAVGAPISPESLLRSTAKALKRLRKKTKKGK